MVIYIILFIGIYLISYFTSKNSKLFCILTGAFLWILLAFRNISMGLTDTGSVYLPYFEMLKNMNLMDILQYKWMSDKVFFIAMKLIQIIFGNYQVCIAILSIPFIALPMYIIHKFSLNKRLSVIIFISLFYGYGYFLIRQSIALAIVLYAYKFIHEKKLVKFVVTILIAALFHKTALLVLVIYPLCNTIKFSYINYLLIGVSVMISIFLKDFIIYFLQDVLKVWHIQHGIYSIAKGFPIGGFAILLVLLVVSTLVVKKLKITDRNVNCLLNISTISVIIYAFSNVIVEAYRFSLYFSIFNVLLLSNVLYNCKYMNQKIYKFGILGIECTFILYFLFRSVNNFGINPYIFFMQ